MAVDYAHSIETAYKTVAAFDTPNPMQQVLWQHVAASTDLGVGVLVKAPTASGKTEAVAVPALATERRLIMIYPSRSLVDDQTERFAAMMKRCSEHNPGRPFTLNIDTGAIAERRTWIDGNQITVEGNIHRHLYHGNVIITTLDKFLYRFFGYGESMKGYTFPLRIHFGLRNALICFDEAHSYDDVAFTNFCRLVRTLFEHGRDLVLMTATMPEAKRRDHLEFLETVDFVDDEANAAALLRFELSRDKEQRFPDRIVRLLEAEIVMGPLETEDDEQDAQESVLVQALVMEASARCELGKRVIVTVEKVEDAVTVWRQLKDKFAGSMEVLLYHGRLAHKQRQRVYKRLLELEREQGGYLLVSTSAIEVGCDLNAHVLITQLCDPDRLIQRAGRCNRRQKLSGAEIVIVGDTIPDWLTALDAQSLAGYRTELERQNGKPLDPKPLLAYLQRRPLIDYRIEMLFDMLFEYVYDARLENKPLYDKGLVITRDWEPSLTLCTSVERGVPQNAVSVSMRRCIAKPGEPLDDWIVQRFAAYNPEEGPRLVDLSGWGCAYMADVVACPNPTLYDYNEEEGWVDLPRLFNYGFATAYRQMLVRKEDEGDKKLWYIASLKDKDELGLAPPAATEALTNEEEEEAEE